MTPRKAGHSLLCSCAKHFTKGRSLGLLGALFLCIAVPQINSTPLSFFSADQIIHKRKETIASSSTLTIGLAWPKEDEAFLNGATFAIEEVNKGGGVEGKQITPLILREESSTEVRSRASPTTHLLARNFAENLGLMAVIGHATSAASLAASVTYNEFGVLYIAPSATTPALTRHGFRALFRTIQNDEDIALSLCQFAWRKKFKRIGVVNTRTVYGEELSELVLKNSAGDSWEIPIVIRRSFSREDEDLSELIASLKEEQLDAVILAADGESARRFLVQARRVGFQATVMGGDGLYSQTLLNEPTQVTEGVVVATSTDPGHPPEGDKDFFDRFEKRFGRKPDGWAMQGYDAVNLLVHGIRLTRSFDWLVVSSAIRYLQDWQGTNGPYRFLENGDFVGGTIYFKQVHKEEFVPLVDSAALGLPIKGSIKEETPTHEHS